MVLRPRRVLSRFRHPASLRPIEEPPNTGFIIGAGKLFVILKLFQNKQRNLIRDLSSPQDGPKTKPGTSETHRRPRGNAPVAYVPRTSIWGSIGVLEAAHLQPKKKSPARPEMAPSTRDKPLRCNPAAWEGLGGHPYRRGAPGLRYGANIRTIHPTRAVCRSSSLC